MPLLESVSILPILATNPRPTFVSVRKLNRKSPKANTCNRIVKGLESSVILGLCASADWHDVLFPVRRRSSIAAEIDVRDPVVVNDGRRSSYVLYILRVLEVA
jgi:hypothetical protein